MCSSLSQFLLVHLHHWYHLFEDWLRKMLLCTQEFTSLVHLFATACEHLLAFPTSSTHCGWKLMWFLELQSKHVSSFPFLPFPLSDFLFSHFCFCTLLFPYIFSTKHVSKISKSFSSSVSSSYTSARYVDILEQFEYSS